MAPVEFSAWTVGRAAVATGAPLLLGQLTNEPDLIWAATGGFLVTLIDRGGSYRARTTNLAAVAVTIAVAGALGGLLGAGGIAAVLGMLAWGGATSFLRVYGAMGVNVGLTSSAIFAVSLGAPIGAAATLERGGWLFAGGAWAIVLALVTWPLLPDLPARLAVGGCYRALAAYLREIEDLAGRGSGEHGSQGRTFDDVRRSLEEAWSAVGGHWSGVPRQSSRHDYLLSMLDVADQMLGMLVALSDVTERLPNRSGRERVRRELRQLEEHALSLASALDHKGAGLPRPTRRGTTPAPDLPAASQDAVSMRHAEAILEVLRELSGTADGFLTRGQPGRGGERIPGSDDSSPGRGWLAPIRANLTTDSLTWRHAFRVGICAGLAVAVSRLFDLQLGQWIPLTVIFVLQPYVGTTLVKGVQRVLGTALGALAATAIAGLLNEPAVLLPVLAVLAAAAVVTLPINYTLFAFFVTPTFVLLTERQIGVDDLELTRVANTLIGGVIAIAGSRLIWPRPERQLFPYQAAAAVRMAGAFLHAVMEAPHPPLLVPEVTALRRKLGLEIIDAGESLHRLEIEGGRIEGQAEAEAELLVYLRRLASASVSLAALPPPAGPQPSEVRQFIADVEVAVDDIAMAIAEGRAPAMSPPLIAAAWPPQLQSDLKRIEQPLRMLHGAAARIASLKTA
ncbi:MAG: FUSC family protein [Gemmatimonadota bacterium]